MSPTFEGTSAFASLSQGVRDHGSDRFFSARASTLILGGKVVAHPLGQARDDRHCDSMERVVHRPRYAA